VYFKIILEACCSSWIFFNMFNVGVCRWNNFEIISATEIIYFSFRRGYMWWCEIKHLNNFEIIWVLYFTFNHGLTSRHTQTAFWPIYMNSSARWAKKLETLCPVCLDTCITQGTNYVLDQQGDISGWAEPRLIFSDLSATREIALRLDTGARV